jgi:serine/threonine protein kinase
MSEEEFFEGGEAERTRQETGFNPQDAIVKRVSKPKTKPAETPIQLKPTTQQPKTWTNLTDENQITEELRQPARLESPQIAQQETQQTIPLETTKPAQLRTTSQTLETSQKERQYLPGFQFVEEIGAGGLAQVVQVENAGVQYAFKGLNQEALNQAAATDSEVKPKALRLLRSEARDINALAKEGSKHTPRFAIDATREPDTPGIYVEFIPHSLEERIEKGIEPERAIEIFLQATKPIARLHERGTSLMDIKPSNYRLNDDDKPILVDLNLKRVDEAIRPNESLMVSAVTNSGKTIGTPLYMAPEQEEGKIQQGQEHLVDVFQLGSLLYQTLTGDRPAGTPEHLTDFPKIRTTLGEEQTIKLDKLISRTRARNPTKRPQSVEELVSEVKEIINYKDAQQIEEEQAQKDKQELIALRKEIALQTLEQKADRVEVTKGEIARESLSTIGKIAKGTAKAIGIGMYGLAHIVSGPLILPTMIRKVVDTDLTDMEGNLSVGSTIFGAGVTFAGYSVALGTLEYSLIGKVFLAQLATNALSGAYEVVRHAKNKVKARKQEFIKTKFQ